MASKRMFTKNIVDSDAFLDMPASTQLLYFHLNMAADDDGFVGNPKKVIRNVGCVTADDLKLLIAKKFLLVFESGVIVIKHWRMHNTLSKSRYCETTYLSEKGELLLQGNGAYSFTSGEPINDNKYVEMFKQNKCGERVENRRRTSGEQTENSDIDIGLDKDSDLGSDINKTASVSDHSSFFKSDETNRAFDDYIAMRKQDGAFGDVQIRAAANRAIELSGGDDAKATKMIVNSTIRGWKSIFPLPEEVKRQNKNAFHNLDERSDDLDQFVLSSMKERIGQ